MKSNMITIAKKFAVVGMMMLCAACSSDTSGSALHADSFGTSGSWSASNTGPGNGYYYDSNNGGGIQ